jgi:HEAT repeat protein
MKKGSLAVFCAVLSFSVPALAGSIKLSPLAEELLYGDPATRQKAVQKFNKLPADAQYKLVPDFMVALSDEKPEVRKIASRILKTMGAKSALPEVPPPSNAAEFPDAARELHPEKELAFADMRRELEKEKKERVTLDAADFGSGSNLASPMSVVLDSLKDPDPWVRIQAARRVGMIHPAPLEAIPPLIAMLGAKDADSRKAAAAALGSFGPLARDAEPALTRAMAADPDPAVRQLSGDALKVIQQVP